MLTSRVDINRSDPDEINLYNELLLKELKKFPKHCLRDSGKSVGALLRLSVEVLENGKGLKKKKKAKLKKKCQKFRSKFKNGYSPTMCTISAYLEFYRNHQQLAFPAGKRQSGWQWSVSSYQSVLAACSRKWMKKHGHLVKNILPSSKIGKMASPTHLAYLSFHQISYQLLQDRVKAMKSLLHGSKRDTYRREMNPRIRQLEELRDDKKLGRLIQLLSGKPNQHLDLQTIPSETEGQIIDHYRIQRLINDYFAE